MKPNNQTIKFAPIENKRLFEEVSLKIKELIFKDILKPGDKLPSEIELGRQFRVGRQTIREALRRLEFSGFITIQRGSQGGPIIENTIMNSLSDSLLNAIKISNISTKELTYARLQIEALVLTEAIKNIDDKDIADLWENIANAKERLSKGHQAFRENINFHKLLAKASKNHVFMIVIEAMMTVVANFLSRRGQPNLEASTKITSSHEMILNELIYGSTESAISLMEEHMRIVNDLFTPLEKLKNSDMESL
jgi:GntR family transcriptional regulator, transcriptional repressor for pyruvate dehydrogenase complex